MPIFARLDWGDHDRPICLERWTGLVDRRLTLDEASFLAHSLTECLSLARQDCSAVWALGDGDGTAQGVEADGDAEGVS